jgi:molybdopterin-guanine dinucleotide biosynthesis protein A
MPSRFTSGAYGPELVKTMSAAFDRAWDDFAPRPKNEALARSLMASAVIEAVEAGDRDHDSLVRKATVTLIKAIKIDPDLLNGADAGET